MSNLTNETPQNLYGDLLTTTNSGQGLDIVPRQLQDGFGNPSTITIATDAVNFNRMGGNTFQLDNVAMTAASNDINAVCSPNPAPLGNEAIYIPSGTTAERPAAPVNGAFRYNVTTDVFEGYQNGAWVTFQTI